MTAPPTRKERLRRWLFGPPDPRWDRAVDGRIEREDRLRTPASVCPRKCVIVPARRELVARSTAGGRAEMRVYFERETDNCPHCGSSLMHECGRCGAAILSPVGDRCEGCGLPFPWAPERVVSNRKNRPREWKVGKTQVPAVRLYPRDNGPADFELLMIEADVTTLAVDTIVSNDDVDGRMYTQIASAIKAAAGAEVETQSRNGGPYPRGGMWSTDPGMLRGVKSITHVAAVDRQGRTDLIEIKKCMLAAFDLALSRGHRSIGVAAFGTGPTSAGRDVIRLEDWLLAMTGAAVAYLQAISHLRAEIETTDDEPSEDEDHEPVLSVIFTIYDRSDFEKLVSSAQKVVAHALGEPETPKDSGDQIHRQGTGAAGASGNDPIIDNFSRD